ncbi:GH15 family glucan-1,4-alpha-glucosidase [Kibdelosporangium banguiense]|uniref:GH15 family glucan-1,4-alpha-glucosidase n=1 Tax=Kibdelosporangium banguiense TaxID=1365924 RepID=A0ABS4TRG8_9PSEU|nr:glycoside hydrolase family 15 protein [Kibdelosporangium banguiense]MBP2326992.1 GH15 family glucan-1,4-alpha-glucosidase [Kibdelosporangium banguiense]
MKLSRGTAPLSTDERTRLVDLARRSHAVITRYQDAGGAYPASPTFSAYRGFAWLRDGSFTAEGISRYGDVDSANRFHDWSAGVLTRRRSEVDSLVSARAANELPPVERMLPTRFTFTGENGSDPWWDFQTDGYGMWLWAAVTHAHRHGADAGRWLPGFEVAVDYLLTSWDRPCYDWWEEHVEHRHVSTLGAIRGGLVAVAEFLDPARHDAALTVAEEIHTLVLTEGVVDGHLTKWLGTSDVDGSLPSCVVPFGLANGPLADATLAAVAADLDVDGGVHRFTADVFYGGGQWLLLSALLGWNLAARGDLDGALRHLRWIAAQADADGHMPEQVPHHLLHPGSRDEWIARWGTVANPLLWSHGMYLILADELGLLEDRT